MFVGVDGGRGQVGLQEGETLRVAEIWDRRGYSRGADPVASAGPGRSLGVYPQ